MEYKKRIRIGNDLFQCVSFVEQKYVVLVVSNYTSDVIPCYTLTLLLAWVSNVICNTVRYIFLGNRIIEQGHCHGHFFLLDERRMRSVEQWNDYVLYTKKNVFARHSIVALEENRRFFSNPFISFLFFRITYSHASITDNLLLNILLSRCTRMQSVFTF